MRIHYYSAFKIQVFLKRMKNNLSHLLGETQSSSISVRLQVTVKVRTFLRVVVTIVAISFWLQVMIICCA